MESPPTARSPKARPEVQALRTSEIREVANVGMARKDVMKFWVGESDQPTPEFIRKAAADALMRGETYYTHNLGREDLRDALAAYLERLHGQPFGHDRLAITSAGVNALMLISQAVVSPGDRVVVTVPAWPNIVEIPRILSARLETVAIDRAQGRWRLADLDRQADDRADAGHSGRCSSTRRTIRQAGPCRPRTARRSWSGAAGTASG